MWQAVKSKAVAAKDMLLGSPSTSSQSSAAAPPESAWAAPSKRWPASWNGMPFGKRQPAEHRFPCIGADCARSDVWHDAGTQCLPFRDTSLSPLPEQWQHMCGTCGDKPGMWRGSALAAGGAAGGAAGDTTLAVANDSADAWDEDDPQIVAAVDDAIILHGPEVERAIQAAAPAHWNKKAKTLASSPARAKPVTPESEAERRLMAEAMTKALSEFPGSTIKTCDGGRFC